MSESLEDINRLAAMHQSYQREAEARKDDARVVSAAREQWAREAHAICRDIDSLVTALNRMVSDAEAAQRLGALLSADETRVRLLHLRALLAPIGSGVTRLAADVAPPRIQLGGRFA